MEHSDESIRTAVRAWAEDRHAAADTATSDVGDGRVTDMSLFAASSTSVVGDWRQTMNGMFWRRPVPIRILAAGASMRKHPTRTSVVGRFTDMSCSSAAFNQDIGAWNRAKSPV